jgi:hypothetical protein
VQKIFPIEERQNRRVLAYALAGAVDIPDANGVSIFNFAQEFFDALPKLAKMPIADLPSYAVQLAGLVNERLLLERQSGTISRYPTVAGYPGLIVRAAFLGYYKDMGCLAQLIFHHDNQILCSPSLTKMEVGPTDFEVVSGAKFINRKIFKSKDLRFSKYRTPSVRKGIPPSKLSEATELVRNYIQACIDNQRRDEECSMIGGRVHIATITPTEGFKWVEGFAPMHLTPAGTRCNGLSEQGSIQRSRWSHDDEV